MKYKRRTDLKVQEVSGETLVLDQARDEVHHLNGTASFVWYLCDGTATITSIVERLVAAFDVSPEIAANDVAETIERLQEMRLIEEQAIRE